MKAVIITEFGDADKLEVREVDNPSAGPGEVLIAVAATSLNRADLLQRKGRYDPPAGSPPYPGLEVAGRVIQTGINSNRFAPGDRVMALLSGGGYAEQVVTSDGTVMPVPEVLSLEQAAAIPEAWLTAYSNMIQIAGLRPGETVLIHAGGSGIGTAAIQLAKWWGATVLTTASAPKLPTLRELGADFTIDYRSEAFAERALDITAGEGVQVILDFIGAPYWNDNLRALAPWGRLVLVGLMGGHQVEANLRILMSKKLSILGSTLRDRTLEQKRLLVEDFTRDVLPAFATGALRPVLDGRRFRLAEIADAHRYMESNQNLGKIVVTVP